MHDSRLNMRVLDDQDTLQVSKHPGPPVLQSRTWVKRGFSKGTMTVGKMVIEPFLLTAVCFLREMV